MYCVFLGRATATNAPGAGSVGTSQLAADAVTAAKLNDDIISGQTALGATPADTDEFLVSDAGTIKRVDYSYIKGLANWSESSGNLLPSDASYGIYLGVNSATASNLLDDYEEGTWTPGMATSGGSLSGVSYNAYNKGWYTKIGNAVTLSFSLGLSSKGSGGSGAIRLTGFPFASTQSTASVQACVATMNSGRTEPKNLYGTWGGGYQTVRYENSTGGGELDYSEISNNLTLSAQLTMLV